MALTTGQKITLYEVLQVPFADSIEIPVDQYKMDAVTYKTSNPEKQLQIKIEQRLAGLPQEVEDRLVESLNQWDAINSNTVVLNGSIGGVQGMEYDPTVQLERISSRIKVIIPVMQYHREMTNAATTTPLTVNGLI